MSRASLIWIHTSDVHGALDNLKNIEDRVNELRKTNSSANIILTDGGDVLQGSPVCHYYNYIAPNKKHLIAEAMNRMGYDCMAVGNHDIEAGHKVFDRVLSRESMNFPALCANISGEDGKPYFTPYHIIEKGGVRIAVIGLITPETTHWLAPSQFSGMIFTDPVESARHWIKIVKEKADIVVGLFHIGWNETEHIAETVQDFDLVLYGHDHHKGLHQVGKTLCVAPSSNATSFVELNIDCKSKSIHAKLIDTVSSSNPFYPPELEDEELFSWLTTPLTTLSNDIYESDSYFGPSAFMSLIHRLQLSATHAELSLAAPISYDSVIKKGTFTNKELFKLYNRDSQLYTLRLNSHEIKGILEYSYSLWVNTMKSKDDHALLLDYILDGGKTDARSKRIAKKLAYLLCLARRRKHDSAILAIKHFTINFLSLTGLDYTVDLTKPIGERINIQAEGEYTVAINSYHANGGGNVLTKGAGLSYDELQKRVIKIEPYDLRQCLAMEIKKHKSITPSLITNWKFIPEDLCREALRRDKELLFP